MKPSRHQRAFVLLALAAVAVVSVARLQSGPSARGYAHSVLAYIAASQNETAISPRPLLAPALRNSTTRTSAPMPLLALLPVFMGLVTPLALSLEGSTQSLGRPSPAPSLPFRFQRPPPARIL